jgi:hypothetical protein
MRYGLVLTGVLIAATLGLASGTGAAPVPGTAWSKAPSAVQPVGYWDRQYRRYGPYAVPPAGYRPTAAPGKLRRISLLERPILRRCALQQALSRPKAVTRISARLGRMLEVILDLLDDQAPGLVLTRACGLLHRDLEIAELALDLLARQHMQAAG